MEEQINHKIKNYMSTNTLKLYFGLKVSDALEHLHAHSLEYESVNYIYLVTKEEKLSGVVSIKELFAAHKTVELKDLMTRELVTARISTPTEKVATLALENNIKEVPIIDKDHHLIGIVSADKIMHIIFTEVQDDLLHISGMVGSQLSVAKPSLSNIWKNFISRIPWLVIGLMGGMVTAQAIGIFDEFLEERIILVAFIPLIVYLAGAVSTQLQAIVIRDLALNTQFKFFKYIKLQVGVLILISIVIGLLLSGLSFVTNQDIMLSFTLGVAVSTAITTTIFTGGMMPLILNAFGLDPADGSGPIATVIQDLLSVMIYLSIASLLLG